MYVLHAATLHPAFGDQALDEFHGAQFAQKGGMEADFIDAVLDIQRGLWHRIPAPRVDRDDGDVIWQTGFIERKEGRVAGIAAVPIGIRADIHRLKHGWQAGRGQERLGRDVIACEDADAAGADIGGPDKEARTFSMADAGKVQPPDNGFQRVFPERTPAIGRPELGGDPGGRDGKGGLHRLGRGARGGPEGLHPGGHAQIADIGHLRPERLEAGAGAVTAPLAHAGLEGGPVQGPCRCAGHGGNLDPVIPQDAVQHAPGKGAMRAAALQGEGQPDRHAEAPAATPFSSKKMVKILRRILRHSAVHPPSTLMVVPVT